MSIVRGRGAKVAAGAVLAALALSGCSATQARPPATPTPSPTAAPLFANEDEALAAATEAYKQYQSMSNKIAAEGGDDPQRMGDFAMGKVLEAELNSFRGISERRLRAVGQLKFDSLRLQEANLETGALTAYLCLDVSETDLVDKTGRSIVSPDRRPRLPLEVSFRYVKKYQKMMVTESELWAGTDFC